MNSREEIVGKPGLYLDRSPTGTGKSTADIHAVRKSDRGLIVVPTHQNAAEVEMDMLAADIKAKKYPQRLTDGENQNCWNSAADTAEQMGLSALAAVCPHCSFIQRCNMTGYLNELSQVNTAQVTIATHQRAVHNGLRRLAYSREAFVAIHEDAGSVLSPDAVVSTSDLQHAASVLSRILNDPSYLDWLGQAAWKDEHGNAVADDQLADRRNRIDAFVRHLAEVVDLLIRSLEATSETKQIELPIGMVKAPGTENLLLRATVEIKARFEQGAWRALLAAAAGELHCLGVIVDETPSSGDKKVALPPKKQIIAVWRNMPSENAVVLFADATTTQIALEAYTGWPVTDVTPRGHVERSKRVIQYPRDITRRTTEESFLGEVRGVMLAFPYAKRVGMIVHRTHMACLGRLGDSFACRIFQSTYFGSGSDRASNDWYQNCDLIIVAGTPRVASLAVQRRMIQFGDFASASQPPDWGEICWEGLTESGEKRIVRNRGYRHPQWAKAHLSLVRAAVVQAAGRGRPLLDAGCDVAIISTEECGFPLADLTDVGATCFTDKDLEVLKIVGELSAGKLPSEGRSAFCKDNLSENSVPITSKMSESMPMRSTVEIAKKIGLRERRTRIILTGLESRGFVARVSSRSGWRLTDSGRSVIDPSGSRSGVHSVAARTSGPPNEPSNPGEPHSSKTSVRRNVTLDGLWKSFDS